MFFGGGNGMRNDFAYCLFGSSHGGQGNEAEEAKRLHGDVSLELYYGLLFP